MKPAAGAHQSLKPAVYRLERFVGARRKLAESGVDAPPRIVQGSNGSCARPVIENHPAPA